MYKVDFNWIQSICKCRADGYEDGVIVDTCRELSNIPDGCSWGECKENVCPLINIERSKLNG